MAWQRTWGTRQSGAVSAGAGVRQRQRQAEQQRLHLRGRLRAVWQGRLVGRALGQSEARRAIHAVYAVQWRHHRTTTGSAATPSDNNTLYVFAWLIFYEPTVRAPARSLSRASSLGGGNNESDVVCSLPAVCGGRAVGRRRRCWPQATVRAGGQGDAGARGCRGEGGQGQGARRIQPWRRRLPGPRSVCVLCPCATGASMRTSTRNRSAATSRISTTSTAWRSARK